MIPFLEMEVSQAARLAIGIGVYYGSFFLIFFRGRLLFRFLGFPVHVYSYRNPFDRTCVYCTRRRSEATGKKWTLGTLVTAARRRMPRNRTRRLVCA